MSRVQPKRMAAPVRKIRVLHLASFAGNIGDIANHAGARWLFRTQLGLDLRMEELEIREFYWKQRQFDAGFVEYANSFDLLLIGGGNYFEVWVEKSATGTSIDIAREHLAALKVPTLFYALGVDTGQGYTAATAERFRAFLKTIVDREDMFVCVRNDGSSRALGELVSADVAASVPVMPDGGFFAGRALGVARPQSRGERRVVGINIAGDMADRRYGEGAGYAAFLRNVAEIVRHLVELAPDIDVLFVPHIWRDAQLLSDLLTLLPDPYLRRRTTIGQLQPRTGGLRTFLADYAACEAVIGMRFHANVCPIGMNVPTIGLVSYPQVRLLYEELQAIGRLAPVDGESFVDDVVSATQRSLADGSVVMSESGAIMARVNDQATATLSGIGSWLNDVVASR